MSLPTFPMLPLIFKRHYLLLNRAKIQQQQQQQNKCREWNERGSGTRRPQHKTRSCTLTEETHILLRSTLLLLFTPPPLHHPSILHLRPPATPTHAPALPPSVATDTAIDTDTTHLNAFVIFSITAASNSCQSGGSSQLLNTPPSYIDIPLRSILLHDLLGDFLLPSNMNVCNMPSLSF
ncbi:hypothetical protein ACTXT7_002593 [Hymenolepis weldensis]